MEEDQMDPGLIMVTLTPSGPDGFPGFPPDLLPPGDFPLPEGFLPPEGGEEDGDGDGEMPEDGEEDDNGDGEMPEDGEEDGDGGDGEIPGDFPLPEGFPPLDGLPVPEDIGPPPTVEAELTLDGFIVTGSRDTTVTIKGDDMGDGMMPADVEPPVEPAEPVEEE